MIPDLPRTIPLTEVRRLLGYPPGRVLPERVQSRLETLLVEASSLLQPRGAHERFPLAEAGAVELPLPGPESSLSGFVLGLVTIGAGLEARVAEALHAGAAHDALLLDAIGSAAAEAAADAMGNLIAELNARPDPGLDLGIDPGPAAGPNASPSAGVDLHPDSGRSPQPSPCRVSPGYGGWPLTAQRAVFARLPHEATGVRLLPSMLMVPQKSVTFAMWFDADGQVIAGKGGCSHCTQAPCPRRATY